MRPRTLHVTALVAALALVAGACQMTLVRASGQVVEETHRPNDFRGVAASHAFDVEVVLGGAPSVTVEADDNVMEHVVVRVSDGLLRIGVRAGAQLRGATLRATVTAPELEELRASGAATLVGRDPITGSRLTVHASGASDVSAEVDVADLEVTASGASTVRLEGSAGTGELSASGASELVLGGLRLRDAAVNLSGASSGTVHVDEGLAVDLSGASDLTYRGDARITRESRSGASRLDRG